MIALFWVVHSTYVFASITDPVKGNIEDKGKNHSAETPVSLENSASLTSRSFDNLEFANHFSLDQADVLSEEFFTENNQITDSVRKHIEHGRAIIAKIREAGNYVKYLDAMTQVELPVGIEKTIGNIQYLIGIDSIRLYPTHAEFDAYMEITVPQNNKTLSFMAKAIKFSKSGGIVGDAKLVLLQDFPINFNGDKVQLVLKTKTPASLGTFVRFDCNGFQEMALDANITFSRDMLVPELPNGEIAEGRVTTSFTTALSDWNDLIARVDLPNFQVKKLKGVGFAVHEAVFDFSDLKNIPSVQFPENYEGLAAYGENVELWRGFYVKELSVKLPREFEDGTKGERTEFYAYNMIIDHMGFTGNLMGRNLIVRENGNMDKWQFSLDSVYVSLLTNQLQIAHFSGEVVLPPAPDNPLEYTALIDPDSGNYQFIVSPTENMDFNLWGNSEVTLTPSSYLDIKVNNGKFMPMAVLHGTMTIDAPIKEGGASAKLANIEFENLRIATVGKRISVGSMSLSSDQNTLGKFPIQLTRFGAKEDGNRLGLDVGIKLNLMKSESEGFSADGAFIIWGEIDTTSVREQWSYRDLQINELGIDVVKPDVYELHGRVAFYRGDETYGNGFKGELQAKLNKIDVQVTALFGNAEGTRYWYADALASLENGIKLGPGINAYGFGGGVYHHMRQQGYNENTNSTIGKTRSGIVYLPDSEVHMGFKATVVLGAEKKEAWNGDVTLEININRHGGINQIGFLGNVYVMTKSLEMGVEKLHEQSKRLAQNDEEPAIDGARSQVSGRVHLLYDHSNRVFHGDMDVFVNAGGGAIRGVGDNNRAGWATMHFAPGTWYVHIGSPSDPIGLKVINLLEARSYFMVGDSIPGSPPPPAKVAEILGGRDLDYMRDLNALGTGRGFAFGAHFSVNTGEKKFLIFYGRFEAGAGLDIMVKDYGDASCEGRSGPIGVNGWYANGQAYAYIEGEVGIQVNLKFKKGRFQILQIGAAAVLQAKGPNPFWMKGIVGGRYRILGGLVKGNCSFEVTIGEECKIISNNPLEGIEIIAAVTPADGTREVDVFSKPQAVFNIAVNENFEFADAQEKVRTYRLVLDYLRVKQGSAEIQGDWKWNDDHTVVSFNPFEVLPGKKEVLAEVQVSFEEYVAGRWQSVMADGTKVTESMATKFTTDEAPDYIPLSNITLAYPIPEQYNYHWQQSSTGYVQLETGQEYLFEEPQKWKFEGRFTSEDGGQTQTFPISYSVQNKRVSFNLPTQLTGANYYGFELYKAPLIADVSNDTNVKRDSVAMDLNLGEGNATEVKISKAEVEGNLEVLQESKLLIYRLRTSQYPTMEAKLAGLEKNTGWMRPIGNGVDELGQTFWGEPFDAYELEGDPYTGVPLISFKAIIPQTPWDNAFLAPDLYLNYPIASYAKIDHSDASIYGVPPVKAIYIRQYNGLLKAPLDGSRMTVKDREWAFIYDIPNSVARDYNHLRSKIASHQSNGGGLSNDAKHILEAKWKPIYRGNYPVKVFYKLPGSEEVVGEYETVINNPVGAQ